MELPKLHHPFTALVAGPTGCAKTRFVSRLLSHVDETIHPIQSCETIHPTLMHVVWFYGVHQSLHDEIPNVTFVEGIPSDFQEYFKPRTLFIIDDLMSECSNNKKVTHLFT